MKRHSNPHIEHLHVLKRCRKNREFISYKCHGHKSNFLNVNCHINVLLFVLGGGLHVNILLCELLIVRGS